MVSKDWSDFFTKKVMIKLTTIAFMVRHFTIISITSGTKLERKYDETHLTNLRYYYIIYTFIIEIDHIFRKKFFFQLIYLNIRTKFQYIGSLVCTKYYGEQLFL